MNGYCYAKKGRFTYIIDRDNKEAWKFDGFGGSVGRVDFFTACSACVNPVDVMVVSVIGEPGENICEVFSDDGSNKFQKVIRSNYSSVLLKIKRQVNLADYIIYRIPHEEGVLQVIFLCRIGSKLDI